MLQEYKDILTKIPEHIPEIEMILDSIFGKGDTKYSIHTIQEFSRIEFTSTDHFTASGYMETNLLYYCVYAYFDLMINHMDDYFEKFEYKDEYDEYPFKEFSDGIDIVYNIVMQSGDVDA